MKILFAGSPESSAKILNSMANSGLDVVGVISQPDKRSKRGKGKEASSVATEALKLGIPIFKPTKLDVLFKQEIAHLDFDFLVVSAYGKILPEWMLDAPNIAPINIHFSLLPRYRGASPIQASILNSDNKTGISIITVAEKMDAGKILKQETLAIDKTDTAATLHDRCADLGARLLLETIDDIASGSITSHAQDESKVVEVRKLNKADGIIDWHQPAVSIHNRIRAFNPWPGSRCTLPSGEILLIWKSVCVDGEGIPGEVLDDALTIGTSKGALRLLEVQLAGGKRMQAEVFLHGRPLKKGTVFL